MKLRLMNIRQSYLCLLLFCTLAASQGIPGKEDQDHLHGTVKRSASDGFQNSQIDNLSVASKRQQGWYSGFGKRSTDYLKRNQGFYSGFGKRNNRLVSSDGDNNVDPELDKKSQGWYSSFGKRILDPLLSKRTQAWYSGFGKRTPGFAQLSLDKKNQFFHSGFGKRSQAWFSGFGKRGLGSDDEKRNQGWYSGFGKRTQAWYSGFGKRNTGDLQDYLAKRGQGWYSGFGKRGDSDLNSFLNNEAQTTKHYASQPPFFVDSNEHVPKVFAGTTDV